jgi:hypothetical protein
MQSGWEANVMTPKIWQPPSNSRHKQGDNKSSKPKNFIFVLMEKHFNDYAPP